MHEDLIRRLRALSRHEHDDATIGDDAADALEAMQAAVLSDEQITRIWFESASGKITPTHTEFARAIERAVRSTT